MMGSTQRRLIAGILAGMIAALAATSAFGFVTPRLKPAAPGPIYLSQSDHDVLEDIADALKKKRFSDARMKGGRLSDPIARSLGDWLYFMAEDPKVNFISADAFLDRHGDWPAITRIQAFVEGRIPSNAPTGAVLAFFESRDPVTGNGKVQLARALFANGDEEAGNIHLRDAWVNNNFTTSKERAVLSSFGKRLTKEDHAARVDRLLWGRQVTNARRVFSHLSAHERKKAQARAALLLGAAVAPALYNNLSKDDQLDSGVLLAAVRYYRRSGNQKKAISLASKSPKTPQALRNSRRWWYERQLLMRSALKDGRFADAYTAASNHGLKPGGDFADAEFNAGWIALRFLNRPMRAETHFLALASIVETPISQSRAFYWLGRTAAVNNDNALATIYYKRAAKHYYSYYGQLAAEKLGGAALQQKFQAPTRSTLEDRVRFSSRPTVTALRMLSDLDLGYEFMVFSYHVDDELERPGEYLELASLANGEGAPHLTVRAGKVAVRRNAFAPEVSYPLVFVPEEATRFIAPEIILGLSRQESEFNPRAYSHAGARGVMQLLPSTAQITARKEGLPYLRSALLDDPVYNMTLGSAHLSHLIKRFDGSLILTFAGYNAGAGRSNRWIAEYGDPRLDGVDPVDWVELIPFSETRNYVQRVLENTQVYRGLLNNAPIPGRLSADLERGGVRNRVAQNAAIPSHLLIALSRKHNDTQLSPLPPATLQRAGIFKAAFSTINAEPTSDTLSEEGVAIGGPNASPVVQPLKQPRRVRNKFGSSHRKKPKRVKVKTDNSPDPTKVTTEPSVTPTVIKIGAKINLEIPPIIEKTDEHSIVTPKISPITDSAPAPAIERPASQPISFAEPFDAPRSRADKPEPISIEQSIADLYKPTPTGIALENNAPTNTDASARDE
ncbi:MAG: lytic transglycosylase domain-containing protein [Marinicaulis sp.]|nr:lytic transglycosylase domain-containing protein [Marinicaulis sp.]